jgi:hypothetical protein
MRGEVCVMRRHAWESVSHMRATTTTVASIWGPAIGSCPLHCVKATYGEHATCTASTNVMFVRVLKFIHGSIFVLFIKKFLILD